MGERAPDPEGGKPSGNTLSTEQRIERLESAVKKVTDSLMQEKSEYGKSGGTGNIVEKRRKRLERKFEPWQPHNNLILEQTFAKFYSIEFTEAQKRKINPFSVKKIIHDTTKCWPKVITSGGRKCFTVEVISEEQGKALLTIKQIDGMQRRVEKHRIFNISKSIIYIEEYDMNDFDLLAAELKKEYKTSKISKAPFIKTRNKQTTALLVIFDSETPPEYMYKPGERADTRIYP